MLYNIPTGPGVNLGNEAMLRLRIILISSDSRTAPMTGSNRSNSCAGARPASPFSPARMLNITRRWSMRRRRIVASAHVETETFAAVRDLMVAGERDAALSAGGRCGSYRLLFSEPSRRRSSTGCGAAD